MHWTLDDTSRAQIQLACCLLVLLLLLLFDLLFTWIAFSLARSTAAQRSGGGQLDQKQEREDNVSLVRLRARSAPSLALAGERRSLVLFQADLDGCRENRQGLPDGGGRLPLPWPGDLKWTRAGLVSRSSNSHYTSVLVLEVRQKQNT